jgi:phosphatidylserine decarboxylase
MKTPATCSRPRGAASPRRSCWPIPRPREAFNGGRFATVYLSPRDYHRVHMPWTGTLRETVHVPGRLFSVGPDAVGAVSRLFARNERLVCHFDCDFGPMAVVMVGALLVSGVETVWSGVEIPPYGGGILRKDWRGRGVVLERFAEMARFNYGSTAIVLLPAGISRTRPGLAAEVPVKLGQRLATQDRLNRSPRRLSSNSLRA